MLHEFIGANRQLILGRINLRLAARPQPLTAPHEVDHGAALFLAQLCDTLRWEATDTPVSTGMIGSTGARHGRELLAAGFSLGEVVHDYGDICQAITEIALESRAPITTEEFHTLNRCLDTAIAEAVSEHARITARAHANEE